MFQSKSIGLIGWCVIIFSIIYFIKSIVQCSSSKSDDNSYESVNETLSICDCEYAYRAIVYQEGSHGRNKYTGEKYTTLDESGNSYVDVIDKCAQIYGGVPLNDGGFSKYPAYQDCIKNKNEAISSDSPDTLVVNWDPENSHIYQRDALGKYLYDSPWNSKGFVLTFKGNTQDEYGNIRPKIMVQGHYKVSKKFQLEAKKYAGADYYINQSETTNPGTFSSFTDCYEKFDFSSNKLCDCSNILPD